MNLGWQAGAACAGVDPGLFFGAEGETAAARAARELDAKRVCARCPSPVRRACLDYGESLPESVRRLGVWGGMGQKDREGLRRHRGQMRRLEKAGTA